jgi:hypothetical protein
VGTVSYSTRTLRLFQTKDLRNAKFWISKEEIVSNGEGAVGLGPLGMLSLGELVELRMHWLHI